MNRRTALLGAGIAALSIAAPAAAADSCATPIAPQRYTMKPNGVVVLSGSGDLTATVTVPPQPGKQSITFQTAYSGTGRFAATVTDPSGRTGELLTAIVPKVGGTGMASEPGDYVIDVASDAPWAMIIQ